MCMCVEHRDKLHGTLSTFDAVDKKIRGELLIVLVYVACPLPSFAVHRLQGKD